MEYDKLKDVLMNKIYQEFSEYKQNLVKKFTKEEIIDKSKEITKNPPEAVLKFPEESFTL